MQPVGWLVTHKPGPEAWMNIGGTIGFVCMLEVLEQEQGKCPDEHRVGYDIALQLVADMVAECRRATPDEVWDRVVLSRDLSFRGGSGG